MRNFLGGCLARCQTNSDGCYGLCSSMRSLLLLILTSTLVPAADLSVVPIPESIRTEYKLDRFYRKMAKGVEPYVIGSDKVRDQAIAEAAWIVSHLLDGRDDLRKAMMSTRTRLVVLAASETTTDCPEHSFLRTRMFWDRRARGLGATPQVPVVSCGEENVLGFVRDPYPGESIVLHEYAHAMHLTGLNITDPTFDDRLKLQFERATKAGLWANTYAATNKEEYWAEGVQCWFDDNAPADALHNHIRTRAQLKTYDAGLAALCKEVFGDKPWRYVRPHLRPATDRVHLAGFDLRSRPRFQWKAYPISDKPVVKIQTSAGDFEVTLDSKAHPAAVKNFLAICLDGGYHSGSIPRAKSTQDGGWIGGRVKKQWLDEYSKELLLDTLPSPLLPTEHAIAFVKNGAAGEFVIFSGKPTGITTGLVPFGVVTNGHDIVKSISGEPSSNGQLVKPVDIRRAIRSE